MVDQPISSTTWQLLVNANKDAVLTGWAVPGVFATGIGPDYKPGKVGSLLFVGKSAGPLAHAVGSCIDQAESGNASTAWMIQRKNLSAFWQFVDKIDPSRRTIAWTNLCKMDRVGGHKPPSDAEWKQVSEACIAALEDEISVLAPQCIVLATSGIYQHDIQRLLKRIDYQPVVLNFGDGWTSCFKSRDGKFLIQTKHPQGWATAPRDRVIDLAKSLMSGVSPHFKAD